MKPLYTAEQFDFSKSRDLLPLECEHCHKIFNATKNNIQWALKTSSRNYLRMCSHKCRNTENDKRNTVKCKFCNKDIKRSILKIQNNKYHFCSNSCSTTYW